MDAAVLSGDAILRVYAICALAVMPVGGIIAVVTWFLAREKKRK
jgi:hypothetical protein